MSEQKTELKQMIWEEVVNLNICKKIQNDIKCVSQEE